MSAIQVSSSLYSSIHGVCASKSARTPAITVRNPITNISRVGSVFATGSPLLIQRCSSQRKAYRSRAFSIKCEQSTKGGNGVDVWLGRLAMIGFAAAIGVEISTGRGLLENFGLTSPLPTVALAVTILIGVLTSIFIFQSASKS